MTGVAPVFTPLLGSPEGARLQGSVIVSSVVSSVVGSAEGVSLQGSLPPPDGTKPKPAPNPDPNPNPNPKQVSYLRQMEASGRRTFPTRFLSAEGCYSVQARG